jgi:cyclic pyranopterin phosphate synthase
MIEVTDQEIPLAKVIDSVRRPEGGALVVFLGTVRKEKGLEGLDMEAYLDMAEMNMGRIRDEAIDRFGVLDASIVHRVGEMGIGVDIVAIAVSAGHRPEAFEACRFLIDELKMTVPIWKKEVGPGTWVKGETLREPGEGRTLGMIDVSSKDVVGREATAEGFVSLSETSLDAIRSRTVRKGDVLEVARVTALAGVKQTPAIIPHCHPIPVTGVDVEFEVVGNGIWVRCRVKADYKTGVEMEALTGVSTALLTIWDMVKYLEKDEGGQYPSTRISDIRVLEKKKGPGGGS